MKLPSLVFISSLLFLIHPLQSQEFTVYSNGLIYHDTTITQLRYIVDSLNLKYKQCDLDKVYMSKAQAKGHYLTLHGKHLKEAKADMDAGMSFEDFIKKHKASSTAQNLLITYEVGENYEGEKRLQYYTLPKFRRMEVEDFGPKHLNPERNSWVYVYYKKNEYSGPSITALYFETAFSSAPIKEDYARLMQYVDCMVDTNELIMDENAKTEGYDGQRPKEVAAFLDYVYKETNRPESEEYDEEYDEEYYQEYRKWDSLHVVVLDSHLSKQQEFKEKLIAAVNHIEDKQLVSGTMEFYVARYHSKKVALNMARRRRVVGMCSMDSSPRYHALKIALLSAETVSWETFLRAHLNIMNDKFERASDGSYAWRQRETYIKELEVLDFNVSALLLGTILEAENLPENHYYGSVRRIGRSLTEAGNTDVVEEEIHKLMRDPELDLYNRLKMYYLFQNYTYYHEGEAFEMKKSKLEEGIASFPDYIALQLEEELKED